MKKTALLFWGGAAPFELGSEAMKRRAGGRTAFQQCVPYRTETVYTYGTAQGSAMAKRPAYMPEDKVVDGLERISSEMHLAVTLLQRILLYQTKPPPGLRSGPTDKYLCGRWRRRDGTLYAPLATTHASDRPDAHDTPGDLRPPPGR